MLSWIKMKQKILCHDIHNNTKEIKATKLIFRPAVYGILIENNYVLLSKQWDGYDFPGGGIHINETIKQALKREFLEETGLKIELIRPVTCTTSFFNPNYSEKYKGQYWNCPLIYFLVKKAGGTLSIENIDKNERQYIAMPEWIDINTIDKLKFYNSIDNVKLLKELP
jgi:8-oxo-dGTP pyrophosphatase MutT (NUDIX family)